LQNSSLLNPLASYSATRSSVELGVKDGRRFKAICSSDRLPDLQRVGTLAATAEIIYFVLLAANLNFTGAANVVDCR
jgi:hypothetical protein